MATGTFAILNATGTQVTALVVADPNTASANGWVQLKPGMVVGATLMNGQWVAPGSLPPLAQAGQDMASTAPDHLKNAYLLMQEANAGTDTVAQQLAAGLVDVCQSLWLMATLMGYRYDLPSTVAVTTTDMPAGTPVTTIACTPLSGSIAEGDTLLIMLSGTQIGVTATADAAHAATSISVESLTPSVDIPAGTFIVDEVTP